MSLGLCLLGNKARSSLGSLKTSQFFELSQRKETMKRRDWVGSPLSSIFKEALCFPRLKNRRERFFFSQYNKLEPTPEKPKFLKLDHCQLAPQQTVPPTRL